MQDVPKTSGRFSTVLMLGLLTALSPFSIDMYLPAFPTIADALKTGVPEVALTLTSYFVGLAAGQLFYGPVMDRYGRKTPLALGLLVYIIASLACGFAPSIESLILFRLIQALGCCGAGVAAFAMVRDLFTPKESAKVLSTLVLILGASPLLAPTVGSLLAGSLGWSYLFFVLAAMGVALLSLVIVFLPETREADPTHELHPVAILKGYRSILLHPVFLVYAFAGAIGFAGLFIYLAASPIIFMEIFAVSQKQYAIIFAVIAAGFVITSQANVLLLRRFRNETVLMGAISSLALVSGIFALSAALGWTSVGSVVVLLFLILASVGLANPNAAALTMAPFGRNAGSAAALLGFVQMTTGAVATFLVGLLKLQSLLPVSLVFLGTSVLSLAILVLGRIKPRSTSSGCDFS